MLVDASVLLTLAEIGSFSLLRQLVGTTVVPEAVADEVTTDPAERALDAAVDDGWLQIERAGDVAVDELDTATTHLGLDDPGEDYAGDVALLAIALSRDDAVVVSDDKSLRRTCMVLSIPVTGSIGVLVRAVERGEMRADRATSKLLAMDEVGTRLSASLLRRAERLIDDAGNH